MHVNQVEQWFLLTLQEFLPKALALLRFCMTLGRFPLPSQRVNAELLLPVSGLDF